MANDTIDKQAPVTRISGGVKVEDAEDAYQANGVTPDKDTRDRAFTQPMHQRSSNDQDFTTGVDNDNDADPMALRSGSAGGPHQ